MNVKKAVSAASAALIAFAGVTLIATPAFAAGDIVYVKDGAENGMGTKEAPFGKLDQAIQNANAGDIIQIVGTYVQDGSTDVKLNEAVTIQGGELVFRMDGDAKVYLTKDVTFKDISLKARTENSKPFRIFANGHSLTMDNVSITPDKDNTAPTIYTGKTAKDEFPGAEPKVIFKNTPAGTVLGGIVASDEGTPANLPAVITLDEGVTIPEGNKVVLGPNTSEVSLTTSSTKISEVDATGAALGSVTFNTPDKEVTTHLVNVPRLALVGKTTLVMDGTSTLTGNVLVAGTSVLDVRKQQAMNNGTFTIPGTAQGGGFIHINGGAESLLEIKGTDNNVNVVIQNKDKDNEPVDKHKYVESAGEKVTLGAANQTQGCTFDFNAGVANVDCQPAKKGVSLAVTKVGEDDPTIVVADAVAEEGAFEAPKYFKQLVAELQKPENAHLVVFTEAGENQPVVEEGKLAVNITWKAKEAGTFKIENGTPEQAKPVQFTVTTTEAGQVVSYVVPDAPEGKQYANGVTAGKVEVTGADRFAHVTLTLEDKPKAQAPAKVNLVVSIAGTDTVLFKLDGEDRKDPNTLNPADYYALLVDSLKANPSYVLLTDPALIEARDGVEPMIEWQAKQVGSLSIKDGDNAPVATSFMVRTLDNGQVVSYLIPPAPAGKKYQRGGVDVPVTNQDVVLTGEDRFNNVELVLVDIVKEDAPKNPGDQNPGDQAPADPKNPGDQNPGDQAPADPKNPGDQNPGDQAPADPKNPGDQNPGDQAPENMAPNAPAPKQPEMKKPEVKKPETAPQVKQPKGAEKAPAGMGKALPKTGGTLPATGTDMGLIFTMLMLAGLGVASLAVANRAKK